MSAPAYTGDVEVGGPAAVRELPGLTISKLAVSEMSNNAYLLRCTATGEALLVDAAAEPDRLRALIGDADLRTVVTTHGHWDHHRALPEVVEATGAHDRRPPGRRRRPAGPGATPGRARRHRDRRRADARGRAPAGPHARAAIALVWRGPGDAGVHVFTGDSLFPGGVGNTQKDAARFTSLIDDVEERLFGALPDETWVYPGHGGDTTLGAERPHLAEWRARGW